MIFERATAADARALVALRSATAQRLTDTFGIGPWSRAATERGTLFGMRRSQVWVARDAAIVASFALGTRKPWAIDREYFTRANAPLYLTDMAVHPDRQRSGLGRQCLVEAVRIARAWPADAIRLDAYDTLAGAGPFYERCGFRSAGRVVYRGTPLVYFELVL